MVREPKKDAEILHCREIGKAIYRHGMFQEAEMGNNCPS